MDTIIKWSLLTGFHIMLIATQIGRVDAQGSNPASIPSAEVNELLSKGMLYVYEMTNTFLEDIIQTNYITKMIGKADLSSVDTFIDSVTTSYSDWAIYMVGFLVCVALGLVLVIVMLFACFLFPCCRCCGRCGAVNPKKSPVKGSSKCRTCACSIALIVVAAGMVVGVIAMYGTNEALQIQLTGSLFENIDEGIDGITDFFDLVLNDLNNTLYVSYLNTEKVIFGIIENVPADAIKAIDNATGAVTLLNQLGDFAGKLGTLQQNLVDSEVLAANLDLEADQLQTNLSDIAASVTSDLSACFTPNCNSARTQVNSAKVRVDFGVVNVTNAILAVNISLSSGLAGLVDDSLSQLRNVEDSINSSVSSAVGDMKATAGQAGSDLAAVINDINNTLKDVDTSFIKDMVHDVQDLEMYKLATEIAYWFLLGLACVVLAVVLLDLLGLLMGLCLPASGNCCSKSVGYHLLMTGTAFTLIFYWLFALLVALLFIVGGPIHTELCRNIVHNDQPASASVLSIYDGWIDAFLNNPQQDPSFHIRPFEIYSACGANQSFYQAFQVAQFKNITEVTDNSASQVKEATDKFKDVKIALPDVNLTNPNLIFALRTLDDGLSESNLNFTNFYVNTEGNITDPDLLFLADELDALTEVNLSTHAVALRSLHRDVVVPMSGKRDQLVDSLKSAENIIHLVSFSGAADTLTAADATIKNNGTYIISAFVNATADNIYKEIENYVTGVTYNIENEVARCAPLYGSLKTLFDAVCVELLYPLNGYWFGLGCCIFFLIPNIFLSVKLASTFKIGTSKNSVKHRDSDDYSKA